MNEQNNQNPDQTPDQPKTAEEKCFENIAKSVLSRQPKFYIPTMADFDQSIDTASDTLKTSEIRRLTLYLEELCAFCAITYPILNSPPLILPSHYTDAFTTIEIDFPWRYDDVGCNGWRGSSYYRIVPKYPMMSLANIDASFPEINRASNPDGAHGWFWVTKDFLPYIFPMLSKYGWTYKQLFTWVKTTKAGNPKYGMGYWCRNACEYLVFAVKKSEDKKSNWLNMLPARTTQPNQFMADEIAGDPAIPLPINFDSSLPAADLILAPTPYHSAKPDEAYEIIKKLSPGPRLSIFQRAPREGFECFGFDMPGSVNPITGKGANKTKQ